VRSVVANGRESAGHSWQNPFSNRVVRLVQAMVRSAVNADGSLASWRFGRVYLAGSFNVRVTSTPKPHARLEHPTHFVRDHLIRNSFSFSAL
jgi:hypothetical protein